MGNSPVGIPWEWEYWLQNWEWEWEGLDWIVQCFTSPPTQYTVGYMGDGFYRSKDPTNSIKVLKVYKKQSKQRKQLNTHTHTIIETQKDIHKISTRSPLVYTIIWGD